MSRLLKPQYIFTGSLYALEQCGLLLEDAMLLFESDRYAGALVSAAFAREELGRSRILRGIWRVSLKPGASVTLEQLKRECEDHVRKQEAGQLSITQQGTQGKLAELTQRTRKVEPTHPQGQEDINQLENATRKIAKRVPTDRHRQRIRALYVQPDDAGSGWSLPKTIGKADARDFLQQAMNDYAIERDKILGAALQSPEDHDLINAVKDVTPPVQLPKPDWNWYSL